jgi:Fructose-bisphosphate aldolase class-I
MDARSRQVKRGPAEEAIMANELPDKEQALIDAYWAGRELPVGRPDLPLRQPAPEEAFEAPAEGPPAPGLLNADPGVRPRRPSFSYGRALQDSALEAWGGRPSGVPAGQQALHHRARCNGAASQGTYSESMEADARGAAMPAARAR